MSVRTGDKLRVKAAEYAALQTLRDLGNGTDFAKRLECAVFPRFLAHVGLLEAVPRDLAFGAEMPAPELN